MRILLSAYVASFLLVAAAVCEGQAPPNKPLPTPAPQEELVARYPAPPPPRDPKILGVGIQRTMTLLATSTPEHRHSVRVLFYGQSITEQEWSKRVADDLRQRFPNADLTIENRAIGGFASQLLIRPAEHDVYPFYPDLVIFHVFGANQQYEQIIKSIRGRTTAEVLMQTDRVGDQWPQTQPDEKANKGLWWDYMMNHVFLPDIARKYGCAIVDIRAGWLDYLRANHYEPTQLLLKDGAHLNPQGNFVMARLTEDYLVYRPELPDAEWKNLTHAWEIGKQARWESGKLSLSFDGNRLDVMPEPAAPAGRKASVRIDGKKPSEFPAAYRITRPRPGPWSPLFLSRVDHEKPLVLEEWTLKVGNVSADGKKWDFDVAGSVTGPDGSGKSDELFTSRSGRVKIDPAYWFRGFFPPLPNGYVVKWQVLPMFVDVYESPKITDDTKENAVTLIQGIGNEKHTLELTAENPTEPPGLRLIESFIPPVRGD